MQPAHGGEPSASNSSAAAQRGQVVPACDCVCVVLCNDRVSRDRAVPHNAAVNGAVLFAQKEAAHWEHGSAIYASAVAAISAAVTDATAREAAAVHEAHAAQEAIAKKEAEMRALHIALAQVRARKRAEERAHAEAAKREGFETVRQKVAEEKARTEAEIRALKAGKTGLQQELEKEAACAN